MSELTSSSNHHEISMQDNIPYNWDVVNIESVVDEPYGVVDGPFGSNLKSEHYRDNGIPVIQSGFVTSGIFQADSYVYVDQTLFQAQRRSAVQAGDIVMAKIGAQCGTCAILPLNHPIGILAGNSLKITANQSKCRTKYLLSVLHFYNEIGKIDLIKTETAQPAIGLKNLRAMTFLLPPIPEQDFIVSVLDTIDTQIQETEQLIAKLKQVKTGLLHDLLTRGIDENGESRDPVAHPEQFKESLLGKIPRKWEVRALFSICTKVTDGCHQSVKTSADGIPFLYVSCIRDGQILWDQAAKISENVYKVISKGREPKKDLILYTVVGSYGNAALIGDERPFSFQRHIAYVHPDTTKVKPTFLVNWLNSSLCRSHADKVALGNAQKTVTLGHLIHFPVPLPGLEEQERISKVLNELDARLASEIATLDKLKQIKKGLMHDLLTGRVRVAQLAANDK